MLSIDLKEEIESQLTEKFSQYVIIEKTNLISGGCINDAMKLQTNHGAFFLKTNSAAAYPGMFMSEEKGLKLLFETKEITVPSVILQGEYSETSYLVLEWIEQGKRKKNFFEDFGKKLARLHKHTNNYFGLNHNNFIGSLQQSNKQYKNGIDFFIEQRLIKQIELAGKTNSIDNSLKSAFNNLFKKLPEIIPSEPASMLHGDLWSGNFMTDKNGQACLIDPAAYYGFREMDLAMTKLFGGFDIEFYEASNEEFPLQKNWEERIDIFNLYPLLVHVNLFGGNYLAQVKQILKSFF